MKNKVLAVIIIIIGIISIIVGVVLQFRDKPNNSNDNNISNTDSGKNNNTNALDEIVCTTKTDSNGVNTHVIYTFTYKDDKLKKYSKVLKYEYTKESEEAALRYKGESIKKQAEMALKVNGIDITHTEDNYVITNSFIYDLEKFNSESSTEYTEIFPIYNLDDSVDTIVKKVKSWEYTCK